MNEKIRRIRNIWKPLTISLILSLAILTVSLTPKPARAVIMTTFNVPNSTGRVGDTIIVPVNVYDTEDLWGWQVLMRWNQSNLNAIEIIFGDFLAGQPLGSSQLERLEADWLMATETSFGGDPGVTASSGWLMSVKFEVLSLTQTLMNIDDPDLTYWMDSTLAVFGDDPDEMIKESGSYIPPWIEDINADGIIDAMDLAYVAINYGKNFPDINPPEADINGDDTVDIIDLSMVGIKYGQYTG